MQTRAFLGLRSRGATKDSLQHELQRLNEEIFGTIDEEVRAFWHHLEVYARQHPPPPPPPPLLRFFPINKPEPP